MLLSIKTQLKLNQEQRVLMAKYFGIFCFNFNWSLANWQAANQDSYKPNYVMIKKFLHNSVKPSVPGIKEKRIYQKVTKLDWENLGYENLGLVFKNLSIARCYHRHNLQIIKTHQLVAEIRLDATHKATTFISQNQAKNVGAGLVYELLVGRKSYLLNSPYEGKQGRGDRERKEFEFFPKLKSSFHSATAKI